MPFEFARGLWAITAIAFAFTIGMEMVFGPAAIHAGEWLTLALIGVLGFLVWSVALGILFFLCGR
jgi:nitrate reductase NapE component